MPEDKWIAAGGGLMAGLVLVVVAIRRVAGSDSGAAAIVPFLTMARWIRAETP